MKKAVYGITIVLFLCLVILPLFTVFLGSFISDGVGGRECALGNKAHALERSSGFGYRVKIGIRVPETLATLGILCEDGCLVGSQPSFSKILSIYPQREISTVKA